jgi:ribose transport system permease protein
MIKKLGLDKFSALYLWAIFMIWFSITKHKTFLSRPTLNLVLSQNVVIGVVALAFLIPLTTGTFDLSIGTMMTLSLAIVSVIAKKHTMPMYYAVPLALAICALAGFISGFFVVKLRVNSFIATLGMSQVLTAICLKTSNSTISGVFSNTYTNVGSKLVFGQPLIVFYLLILAIIGWYVLEHTPLGRYMFATGGNPEAARLAGIRTDRYVWGSLVASAVLGGFAGIVFSWKVGNYTPDTGPAYLFPAIAAVFFGASQLKGRANVWGAMIALYSLAWGVKGLQLTFTNNTVWIEPLFQGVALLAAVALASHQGVIKVRKKKVADGDSPSAAEPAIGASA